MQASEQVIAKIKEFEGFESHAYNKDGVWTVGYGSTRGVKEGRIVSEEEADGLLRSHVKNEVETAINAMVKVPLKQSQYDALVDWVYNLGAGKLQHSHLLAYINQEYWERAGNEFGKWVLCQGKILPGLIARRAWEKQLFLS